MGKKKFVIKKNENKSVNFNIRVDEDIRDEFDEIAAKTNLSRNYLINKALRYALENAELEEDK